ncbi:hypothetical protein COW36_00095 [bacterium (Candidatus Blackallbacteria) CG17_big_fil_post_rev_8_21_14_2_50_48_46]|uniref:HAD family phosphatase n=1 Tax=bacterium (Candidatus Blackallbacteria) CG17_big_fil_post_rev_8_21_14_2_50_48_46 TaxID=2014261 RepID=A0A2M7GBU1_9BACT|nr:MAG: hypothetical protein COW64_07795 [bacterium (Candidatus Blackallbacteria) CG18_big_fil_WC_8_21_14_2_50_49_26]PIW19667.1 MAG: hypothetical protein COW36_00095 [bacterium (Candidatus Blackallbacteria) CG17_big_fil_post_rev_8_21_14_2_50_48_46]PIW44738.1 MAG: hypothetical protein COW20_23010 [bacterium (Candidatus Blackallbacteria) CG13_big_fil_rev_8_21_14_2_50_49_14]
MKPGALITDLDGTLLDANSVCSQRNLAALKALGGAGILRVAATGRSLFSARKVLSFDFPIDYLIFSSGAGVMQWARQELIFSAHLQRQEIQALIRGLQSEHLDFMIHGPIPENHCFYYQKNSKHNPDFDSRLAIYQAYAKPWQGEDLPWEQVSEILVIVPETAALARYHWLSQSWPQFQIIRATSPLDYASGWLEIFPAHISKSQTSAWLLQRYALEAKQTLAIGNDYNDQDLLAWAGLGCVVNNAPEDLRSIFTCVAHHCEDGFSEAVALWSESTGLLLS